MKFHQVQSQEESLFILFLSSCKKLYYKEMKYMLGLQSQITFHKIGVKKQKSFFKSRTLEVVFKHQIMEILELAHQACFNAGNGT